MLGVVRIILAGIIIMMDAYLAKCSINNANFGLFALSIVILAIEVVVLFDVFFGG